LAKEKLSHNLQKSKTMTKSLNNPDYYDENTDLEEELEKETHGTTTIFVDVLFL
jgi:hypothetical protein